LLSILTYGPAKAAPANRNGDAAIAAIVDLIDMFFIVSRMGTKKPLRMRELPTWSSLHYAGVRSFDSFVLVFIISQTCVFVKFFFKRENPLTFSNSKQL